MRLTEEVVEAVKELEDRQGRLLPSQVLDAARDESSPLHDFFEWDDSAANILIMDYAKWDVNRTLTRG